MPVGVHVSVSICLLAYSTISFFGYMTFYDQTAPNFLASFAPGTQPKAARLNLNLVRTGLWLTDVFRVLLCVRLRSSCDDTARQPCV